MFFNMNDEKRDFESAQTIPQRKAFTIERIKRHLKILLLSILFIVMLDLMDFSNPLIAASLHVFQIVIGLIASTSIIILILCFAMLHYLKQEEQLERKIDKLKNKQN